MVAVREHREAVRLDVVRELEARLHRVGLLLVREVKLDLSIGGGAERIPSTPPAPPHTQSGRLKRDIRYEVFERGHQELVLRYGTNVAYARRLELGFVGADSLGRVYHQRARPFLRNQLTKRRREIKRELNR